MVQPKALLVGNSDGIGLATTKRLLEAGWDVIGVSRSESLIENKNYRHRIADVSENTYPGLMDELVQTGPLDLCIYFVGIGELLDLQDMSGEGRIIDVNLVKRGQGHFIGVSSMADELLSAEAPSYNASKAGFSNYLGGLALALKPKGVFVTNVRFGFVDTKMAKSDVKPFMMSVEKAVDHLEACIKKKPARYTAPKIMIPLLKLLKLMMKLRGK
jgi:short-subunit dehydrogenase